MRLPDPFGVHDGEGLGASLDFAERKAEVLRGTLSKTQEALTRLHDIMLPDADAPKDLVGLADVFHSSDEAIRRFSFAQTERGVSSFLAVALANGVKADFEAITTKYPTDAEGRPKSTRKFMKTAGNLAKQFSELIRVREAEKAKAAAGKSSAPSESGAA